MADIKEMRIFAAEQISVPEELPGILKNYAKEVIKNNPSDIIAFSADYFERLYEDSSKGHNK
jgi:Regulatory subunit of type II PKA R-subunit